MIASVSNTDVVGVLNRDACFCCTHKDPDTLGCDTLDEEFVIERNFIVCKGYEQQ